VFAIAPSEIQRGLIWAGTNDGKVWNTRDGGSRWNDVTKNIPGLPAWGTVRKIEPSHFDPGTAYVAIDFHLVDNRDPFIYKTTDFGQTWRKISDSLPATHPLAYALSVAENPNRRGMLFAGTGHAFFYSLDDGGHWTQFKDGLPAAPVTWIVVPKQAHDVVISTYGRGLFILNDITRLEQGDQVTTDADAFLYAPRPGYRLPRSGSVDFLYSLKSAPSSPLKLEILDAGGPGSTARRGTCATTRRRRSSCGRRRRTIRTSGKSRASRGATRGRSCTGASSRPRSRRLLPPLESTRRVSPSTAGRSRGRSRC
jgi:hypothetical protein